MRVRVASELATCTAGNLTIDALSSFSLPGTFDIVYQGMDDRPLMVAIGRLYACAHRPLSAHDLPPPTPLPPSLSSSSHPSRLGGFESRTAAGATRLRVGFLSAHFRRHSVCKLWCGLVARLPRESMEVVVVLASDAQDEWTPSQNCTIVRVANGSPEAAATIKALALDVLVYPSIGMHQATYM